MTQTIMQPEYFGPPIDHPGQQHIATWHGNLLDQDDDFQQGIYMLRTGWEWSKTTIPDTLDLIINDDMRIKGTPLDGYSSITRPDGKVRFVLAEWDERILRFFKIEVKDDDIKVEVWENPPDPRREVKFSTIS